MAAILRQRWRQQPRGLVDIDWSHPLASGLIYSQMPGSARRGFFRLSDQQITNSDFGVVTSSGSFSYTTASGKNGVGFKGRSSLTNNAGATSGSLTLKSSFIGGSPVYTYAGLFERSAFDTTQSSVATFAINAGGALSSITQNLGSTDTTFATRFVDISSFTQSYSALVNGLIVDKGLNVAISIYENNQIPVGIFNNNQLSFSNSTVFDGASTTFSGHYINATGTYIGLAAFFWVRKLSAAETASFTENPWQMFAPIPATKFYSLPTNFQYSRPTSDILTGWSSTGADHFAQISETTSNQADYVYATSVGAVDSYQMGQLTQPPSGSSIDLNFDASGSIKFELLQGATVIKSQTVSGSSAALVGTFTISSAELSQVSWPWNPVLRITSQ